MKKSILLFILWVVQGVVFTGIALYKWCQSIWYATSNNLPTPGAAEALELWQWCLFFFCSVILLILTYIFSKREKVIPIKIITLIEMILYLVGAVILVISFLLWH